MVEWRNHDEKTVSLLALLAALCCLFTVSAAAADAPTSGTCGENLTWTLDTTGTLTISGTGAMEEYKAFYSAPWEQYRKDIQNVEIKSGVTSIGKYGFSFSDNLKSITIPESITRIGDDAFTGCSNLMDVYIIDMDAWCHIVFNDTPMSHAKNIWLDGKKIVSVNVPQGITSLDGTFCGFKNLIQVTLPGGLTNIGDRAFSECSSLICINIPEGVTSIGVGAFLGCSSLTSISIPKSVVSIGDWAFSSCSNLESVSITDLAAWCQIDFDRDVSNPLYWAKNLYLNGVLLKSIEVPTKAGAIKSYAFCNYKNLTSISISEGITAIGTSVFSGCSSLSTVNIAEGVMDIGSSTFEDCNNLISINIPSSVATIDRDTFWNCRALTDVRITDLDAWFQIEFADGFASPFYYAKNLYLNGQLVESLEIPGSVSVIPAGLFRNAACLKRVAIPRSLAGVAANAFENCTNITEVFYEGSESEWTNLPISAGNDPLKNAQVYFGSTLENYYCRITVAVSDGGRVTVDHTTAKVGETVTVTAAPYPGYELAAICVDGAAIQGNTFTVTGNHVVSARFTRVPVVGGNEDFRLEGISVRTAAGDALQELPAESLLVTVAVKHLNETGSGTILLAQYDSLGRYRGLMWLTLDEMPQGMTLRVILPVDNSGGEIANLKVFVVEDLTSPLPVGTPVSFGTV